MYVTCVRVPVEARERVGSSRATVTEACGPPDVGAGDFKMIYFLSLVESLNYKRRGSQIKEFRPLRNGVSCSAGIDHREPE